MDTTFREATASDCLAVAKAHVRSWQESFAGIVPQPFLDKMSIEQRAKAFEKRFADASYKMYVAALGRGVVGFADFGDPREPIGTYEGELYAIYLLPEFQRMGIGGKLFRLGVESLISRGKNSMYLLALEVSPYRKFYEKMGGQVVGKKSIVIEGLIFDELVYGWDRLDESEKIKAGLKLAMTAMLQRPGLLKRDQNAGTHVVSTCEKRFSAFTGIAGVPPAMSAKRETVLSKIIARLRRGGAGRPRSQYLDAAKNCTSTQIASPT